MPRQTNHEKNLKRRTDKLREKLARVVDELLDLHKQAHEMGQIADMEISMATIALPVGPDSHPLSLGDTAHACQLVIGEAARLLDDMDRPGGTLKQFRDILYSDEITHRHDR